MTHRYLDITNDVAFKKVFSHKEILQDLLNSVLHLQEGKKIEELHFVSQEEIPPLAQGKRSIFDIKVRDQSNFWYIIEMQNRPDELFLKRVQVYASSVHSNQLVRGDPYSGVMPVVVVSIVKGVLFPQEVECVNRHTTREEKTNVQHLFELSYVFIELGKFHKSEDELDTIEDYWLFYLSDSATAKHPPAKVRDQNILKAYEILERFNWNEAAYDAYIRAKLLADTEKLTIDASYTKGIEQGKAEGLEEGIAKGIAKGVAEGITQGKAEGKLEIARNLLTKGLDIKLISEATGLSETEIKKL